MKRVQNFFIPSGKCKNIPFLLEKIDKNLPPHWKKDIEAGERISDYELEYHAYIYCGKQYPLSALFLLIDQGSLCVANIIPGPEDPSTLSLIPLLAN